MSGKFFQFLAYLVVFAIIGIAGWAVVRGVEADPGVVGSFATALGAVLAVVLSRQREKSLELQQTHRENLIPIYEDFIKRSREGLPTDEAIEFMKEFGTKVTLRGPSSVVAAYVKWLRSLPQDGEAPPDGDPTILLEWENVVRAIRQDLGQDDSKLKPGDLLRIFVFDIDNYLSRKPPLKG